MLILKIATTAAQSCLQKSGNPSFADDITIIALSPYNLQNMIDTTYKYCTEWKMTINVEKSNVDFSQKRNAPKVGMLCGDSFIEKAISVTHLGIHQDDYLELYHRINERLQKARNAFLFAMSSTRRSP